MKILADIGGTFSRFVQFENGAFTESEKYRAADFASLEDALAHYCAQNNAPIGGHISIATAAYEDGKNWRFVNKNKWIINAAALKKAGWTLNSILNDFAAATWGLLDIEKHEIEVLHKGKPSNDPLCLTGPGTGLGLGYLTKTASGIHVQRTHGGHMFPTPVTEEQWRLVKAVHGMKENGAQPVFENFVSGPGLHNIYAALCKLENKTPQADGPEKMLEHLDDALVKNSIRLFTELFGLHARSAVITGHAYGGLYLTGGVLKQLAAHDLFDFATFRKFFSMPGVTSVTKALEDTPIIHFTASHLAMKGLLKYEEHA